MGHGPRHTQAWAAAQHASLATLLAVLVAAGAATGPAHSSADSTGLAGAGSGSEARVVLVLDASGSMWGELAGQPKIEVARGVIRELLADWDARVELGLTAYGHRERRSCSDIEAVVPVGPPDVAALVAAARGIRPRGMTPIGASLEHAARQLDSRRRAGTVVLVSDGEETCDVDPCAVARSLAREGVDFTTHVIGFDVTERERAQLRCVAEATGGLFLAADDATSLHAALGEALREARRGRGGVWLAASLGPDGTPVSDALAWRVERVDERGEPVPGAAVVEQAAPTLSLALESGRYRATARLAGAAEPSESPLSARADFDVDESGRARHVLVLDAGRIQLSAVDRDERAIETGMRWQALDEAGRVRAESAAAAALFTLPAGRWLIRARYDGDLIEKAIELRPGRVARERLRFGVGKLALRAVLAAGGSPLLEDVDWELTALDARGRPGGRVLSERRAAPLHTLDTGQYQVRARYGQAMGSLVVRVKPASTATATVDLAAAVVRVYASLPPPGGAIREPVQWSVVPLDGDDGSPLVEVESASHVFVLPAGRYRVQGRIGAMQGAGELLLRSGEETSLQVVLR